MSKSISPEEYMKWGKWIGETEQNVPKDDLISRQAAIDAIEKALHKGTDLMTDTFICGIRAIIENLPAADVQPVIHAVWIEDNYNHLGQICSYCGEPCADMVMGEPRDRFCKWCGAKMDG